MKYNWKLEAIADSKSRAIVFYRNISILNLSNLEFEFYRETFSREYPKFMFIKFFIWIEILN